MTLYLGIDGGGTGCRAVVADASGRVLGQGAAGPANIASDPEGAGRNILAAAVQAMAAAVGEAAVAREWPRVQAGLGLAGANAAGASDRLRQALPFGRMRIETDALTAVKGALGHGDGIVAAIGTGSVFARQRDGAVRQIGGWGLVLGDEGSGAVLGRAILARALRAADGFVALTPLLMQLLAEHGGEAGLVRFALAARPVDFAALVPRLLGSDDPAACAVLDIATAEVAAYVDHLQADPLQADLLQADPLQADPLQADRALPVVFIGGLGPTYAQRLAGRWPVRAPLGTALDGALMLARDMP